MELLGKVFVRCDIHLLTGLRVAGSSTGMKIGGIDQPVITDAFGRPYIPGSSLKGKMRSLIEKKEGKVTSSGKVHFCLNDEDYQKCPICKFWGISPTEGGMSITLPTLTRLIVRDTNLLEESITPEMKRNMEMEFTEIKMETAIDRVKGSALHYSLRTMDRVPAGAIFSPVEIIINIFEKEDLGLMVKVFEAMGLIEWDYLGGMGSRGYGKISFGNIQVYINNKNDYETGNIDPSEKEPVGRYDKISQLIKNYPQLKKTIEEKI